MEKKFREVTPLTNVGISGLQIDLNIMQAHRLVWGLERWKNGEVVRVDELRLCGVLPLLEMIADVMETQSNNEKFSIEVTTSRK